MARDWKQILGDGPSAGAEAPESATASLARDILDAIAAKDADALDLALEEHYRACQDHSDEDVPVDDEYAVEEA